MHVVYSARDVARQVAAEWQEQLKHQRKVTFRTFLEQLRETDRGKATRWFWRVQGLPGVLERWGNGLAPAQVHVVTVPRPGGPPERAVAAVLHRARHRPGVGARARAAAATPRSARAESTLLRRVNARLKEAGLPSDQYRALVRQLVVHETLAGAAADAAGDAAPGRLRLGRGGRPGLDRLGQGRGRRRGRRPRGAAPGPAAGRRRVAATRTGPGRATSPPRPIDAIVALTLEAARRPDPDDTLTSRAAKLARLPAPMTTSVDAGRARAWAWVAHLRAGGTTPWRSWTVDRRVRPRAGTCPAPSSSSCCAG